MEVKYIPENATISCTFRNKLDLSPKSCSIRYGVCNDRMMYNTQRNTTAQSPFVVMLELNSSVTNPMNCYVVTASNDSLTLTVNGRFISETQSSGSSDNAGIIAGSVMGALLVAVTLVTVVIVVLVIVLSKMCREKSPSGKMVICHIMPDNFVYSLAVYIHTDWIHASSIAIRLISINISFQIQN